MGPSAERKALARRRAVAVLRVAEATAGYAAGQVGNGLSPDQASLAVLEAAGELETAAGALRRLAALARLDPAERRVLAVELAGAGWSRREIAARLGVSDSAVRGYLRPRSPAGG